MTFKQQHQDDGAFREDLLNRLKRVAAETAERTSEVSSPSGRHLRLISAVNEIRTGSENKAAGQNTSQCRHYTEIQMARGVKPAENSALTENDISLFLSLIK